jgi:dUTP pyrophosphatase
MSATTTMTRTTRTSAGGGDNDCDDTMCRCLRAKFLSDRAIMPTRGSPLSDGFDLSASEGTVVPGNGGRAIVKTDLSIACPPGMYARIAPRR